MAAPTIYLGMSLADLATPACAEMARQMIARQAAQDVAIVCELEIIAKSDRPVALEVSTRLVIENGSPIGMQGMARDITQRRQTEAALEQAILKLT